MNDEKNTETSLRTDAQRPVERLVMPLPRYGLQWNGPTEFIAAEMEDGYWTPWHIAKEVIDALHREIEVQSYWGPKWEAEHKEVLRLRSLLDEAEDHISAMTECHAN